MTIEPKSIADFSLRSDDHGHETLKAVDAVMVGMGWSGSIMARELTKAGLMVVGLERGADRSPREDFALAPHPRRAQISAALSSSCSITRSRR